MGTRLLATLAAFSLLFTGTAVADDQRIDRFTARSGTADLNGRPVVEKLPCGTTILGHPGGVPGFASFAYTTADLKRRAEFSATASTVQGDPTAAYWKVVNEVFC